MVFFQTKNSNFGKGWRALELKMLINYMVSWSILWTFGTLYGHLVHSMVIWYILWSFGTFYGHLVIYW
jgi:hypothetical protein